jgi:predicted alpha/beta hydrolase
MTDPVSGAAIAPSIVSVSSGDGARFDLLCVHCPGPVRQWLYWLPAMGVPARQYLPLAQALAERGVAVALHEWRGIGSSDRRAGYRCDWGYRELLEYDLPAALGEIRTRWPQATYWLGGHSLGGQLAALYAALHPTACAGLVLVASGAPYWRRFRRSWLVGLAYVVAPWLAAAVGHLPGRRIGFGGNEARGVIADWARSGRTGRYAARGMARDLEQRLASLRLPVLALRLRDDWLGPQSSLDFLLGKMPQAHADTEVITAQDLDGAIADHFRWMKTPAPVAARIASWIAAQTTASITVDPHDP